MGWLVSTGDVTPMHTDPRQPPNYPVHASSCATSGADGPHAEVRGPGAAGHNDLLQVNGIGGFYN